MCSWYSSVASSRGTQVAVSLAKRSDVECSQVCDIHEESLVRIADHMATHQVGRKPLLARRMEEVFANKDVDAVFKKELSKQGVVAIRLVRRGVRSV